MYDSVLKPWIFLDTRESKYPMIVISKDFRIQQGYGVYSHFGNALLAGIYLYLDESSTAG